MINLIINFIIIIIIIIKFIINFFNFITLLNLFINTIIINFIIEFFFINNSNTDASCLNKSKLHLNRKGTSYLAKNFIKRIFNIKLNIYDKVKRDKALECFCISPMFMTNDDDSETALRLNRSKYSKNIFSYLNINSNRNKSDSVRAAPLNYVDIFIATETKINEPFPTAQFAIDGFHKPLWLDAADKSRGLLVYVRSYLPLRQLTKHEISSDNQALVLEINLTKEK